uniref:YabP/YqfC family sporulation protein n=1 Tax=Lachnospira sp. TaxID=2049031 RepID=UPI003FF0CEE8
MGNGMKNPVKNRKKDVEMLADSIGISGTSVSLPVLTLIGNKEMYIENIKSIMEYDDTRVKVLTRRGVVYIAGERLDIGYLDEDEISIKGKIIEITFD